MDRLLHLCVFDDIVNVLWWTGPQHLSGAVRYNVFPSQGWLKKFFKKVGG